MTRIDHSLSWQSIGRIVGTMLILYIVWKTLNILLLILISVMLATALYPLVKLLSRRLPHILANLIVILLLAVPFFILGLSLVPSFTNELPPLIKTLGIIISTAPYIPPALREVDFTQYAQNVGSYVLQSTTIVSSIVTAILTLLFLTFYLMLDAEQLLKLLISLFPRNRQKRIAQLLSELGNVNGQYIRGNLIISLICGIIIYAGLFFLHIPFALPLALFAAILDLLPLVGATIALIPAIIIALSISPVTAILVAGLYIVYQQIEGAILAPSIYNKALKLSPALGFLAVILGAALYGVVGAFLALPVAASLPAILRFAEELRRAENEGTLRQRKSVRSSR
jgi:predicted PurR-regulated permease PerM